MEYEKVLGQQSKERKERLDKAVEESRAKLKEAIPSWSDELYGALLKRGVDTYGFKPDEVGEVYDPRVMRVLHDAHQFHLLKAGKETAEKKVVAVPPVLKRGASEQKPNPQTQAAQNARTALSKNGNDIDAAAAVMGSFIQPVRR
jgi:alanyl-tRNA synthetase